MLKRIPILFIGLQVASISAQATPECKRKLGAARKSFLEFRAGKTNLDQKALVESTAEMAGSCIQKLDKKPLTENWNQFLKNRNKMVVQILKDGKPNAETDAMATGKQAELMNAMNKELGSEL